MATYFSILAWEISWTEEAGGLQSMGSQRVGTNVVTKQQQRQEYGRIGGPSTHPATGTNI